MMFFFLLGLTNNRKTSLYFFSRLDNLHQIFFWIYELIILAWHCVFFFLVEILHGIFTKSQKVFTKKYSGPPKITTNLIHSHIDCLRWFISRKRAFEGLPPFSIQIIQSIAFFAAVVVLLVELDPFN